jgi:hypothetical protein
MSVFIHSSPSPSPSPHHRRSQLLNSLCSAIRSSIRAQAECSPRSHCPSLACSTRDTQPVSACGVGKFKGVISDPPFSHRSLPVVRMKCLNCNRAGIQNLLKSLIFIFVEITCISGSHCTKFASPLPKQVSDTRVTSLQSHKFATSDRKLWP